MRRTRFFAVAAAIAAIAVAGCEGPAGPQGEPGPAPDLVVDIDVESTDVSIRRGGSLTIAAAVIPADAIVQTLRWELLGEGAEAVIGLGREPGSALSTMSGTSVVVTALSGGSAEILVTALGSAADDPKQTVIAVSVEDVSTQLADLRGLYEAGDLPAAFEIRTAIADERLAPQSLSFGGEEVVVTLVADEPGHSLFLDEPGSMFTVGYGVTLVLDGITLRGMAGNSGGALVTVAEGGTLALDARAGITDNANTSALHGGGVRVNEGGTLDIADGWIGGNSSVNGGGVWNDGTFEMTGGEIAGNSAGISGGGVTNGGTFVMSGGEISDNTAVLGGGGVHNDGGEMTLEGGASVSDNRTQQGGGVRNGGTLDIRGAARISGNAAEHGGGVFNYSGGTLNLHDGEISDNVILVHGGGVRIASGTTFNMHGGVIAGNRGIADANGNNGTEGGGVNNNGGVFNMHGGRISGNSVARFGAGVNNNSGTFRMAGGIIHGTDAADEGLRNSATNNSAFQRWAGITQFGTFDGENWTQRGNLTNNHLTVEVVDGNLVSP